MSNTHRSNTGGTFQRNDSQFKRRFDSKIIIWFLNFENFEQNNHWECPFGPIATRHYGQFPIVREAHHSIQNFVSQFATFANYKAAATYRPFSMPFAAYGRSPSVQIEHRPNKLNLKTNALDVLIELRWSMPVASCVITFLFLSSNPLEFESNYSTFIAKKNFLKKAIRRIWKAQTVLKSWIWKAVWT